jgi:hypothetical protein
MPVGFQAFTDAEHGSVFQIDGETPNYQVTNSLVAPALSTTLATVYNNGMQHQYSAAFWWAQVGFTAKQPLVAFAADGGVMCCPWKFSGGNSSGSKTGFTAEFIAAGQTNIKVWVFDQVPPDSSTHGFGLQVFNSNGVLIADAASPFARVIDVIQGQYLPGMGFDATGTTMPGPNTQSRRYPVHTAIAACYPAHYTFSTGGDIDGETTMSGIGVSNDSTGSTVTWEFHTYAGSRGSHFIGYHEASAYSFLVLDMTGIIQDSVA